MKDHESKSVTVEIEGFEMGTQLGEVSAGSESEKDDGNMKPHWIWRALEWASRAATVIELLERLPGLFGRVFRVRTAVR